MNAGWVAGERRFDCGWRLTGAAGGIYRQPQLIFDDLTEPYLLIMEYVMYGRLLTFLRDHRTQQSYYNYSSDNEALTSRDLTTFSYCVAKGMEYIAAKGVRAFSYWCFDTNAI